ncbi:hypothetical protein F5Y11DRAFT_341387 [Daldinia sp. FL1419]|nr:hypothetical protein F5Y11DRAFT_341387 [Daldinia sp. FL1419]
MKAISYSRIIQATRPSSLLSRTGTQLHLAYSNRVLPHRFGHLPSIRSFHFAPAAAAVLETTQNTMLAIHNLTHTPWFLTIPLVALGVSLAFRLPFKAYVHWISQRRTRFTPVLMGWTARISRDIKQEGIPVLREHKELVARHKRARSRIYGSVGLQEWKLYCSVLGIPFWLIGIESVRRICGGPRGLIGQLFLGKAEDTSSTQTDSEIATSSVDTTTTATSSASVVDPSTTVTTAEHVKDLLDPSITLEGCLWFPDLTAPDPLHILPFALSSLLVWNMLPKSQAGLRQLAGLPPADKFLIETPAMTRQRRLRRVLLVLSALVGPMTADLPTALHLYWLTTSATHTATSALLSKLMPIESNAVQRCTGVEADIIRPKRTEKPKPTN